MQLLTEKAISQCLPHEKFDLALVISPLVFFNYKKFFCESVGTVNMNTGTKALILLSQKVKKIIETGAFTKRPSSGSFHSLSTPTDAIGMCKLLEI